MSAHDGPGTRRAPVSLGAFLLVAALALAAAAPDIALDVGRHHGTFDVAGRFDVDAPPGVAWDVLTDYAGMGRFVRAVRRCEVLSRHGHVLRLAQDAEVAGLLVKRTVRVEMRVTEHPERRLEFEDELGRDFRTYAGEWTLEPRPGGTHVEYRLEARPRSTLAALFGRGAADRNAGELLTEVRHEMLRRSALAQARSSGPRDPPRR